MDNTKVLIVTNEKILSNNLRDCLMDLGYTVAGTAASNDELYAKIQEFKPGLILTDIYLNGIKAGGIKTGEPINSNFNMPIIYITGDAGQITIQRARDSGLSGYIFKPLDKNQIYATIEAVLIRHQLEAELWEGRWWLNAVLDNISDGVIALDNWGTIRFMNPIAEQLTGWNKIQTESKTLFDVFVLMRESSHERMEILVSRESLTPKNAASKFRGMLLSKNGTSTLIEANATIVIDKEAAEVGFIIVFRDIAEREEALMEIQRQNQRAEALAESAGRLISKLELNSVLETICKVTNEVLKASATGIFLLHGKNDVFHYRAHHTQLAKLKKFKGTVFEIPGIVFETFLTETTRGIIIEDIQDLSGIPYLELAKEEDIHSAGVTGLFWQHKLVGVLFSLYTGAPVQIHRDTLSLLEGLADQAVISINNANLFEKVQRGREHQQALTAKLVQAQEIERRHLSMELHDQVGQMLTGLQFILESSKNQARDAHAKKLSKTQMRELVNTHVENLNEAQNIISEVIDQIREISLSLNPPMLEDFGLLPTLLWHFERYQNQTGIEIAFHHNITSQRLPADIEIAVYRIIQESLTNVARYARVTEATVQLTFFEDIIQVEVIDRGIGFTSNNDELKWSTAGLAGMRERANMLGGSLVIESIPGTGTRIQAMLPFNRKPMERRENDRNIFAG